MDTPQLKALTPTKQKYVKARLQGKNKKDAALWAGYSKSMSRSTGNIETPDVKAVFRALIQKAAPMDKLAQRLAEGLDACETKFFQKDGVVTDKKDVISWSERREYLKLAAEYGGYAQKDDSSVSVNIITTHSTSLRPVDVIDVNTVNEQSVKEQTVSEQPVADQPSAVLPSADNPPSPTS